MKWLVFLMTFFFLVQEGWSAKLDGVEVGESAMDSVEKQRLIYFCKNHVFRGKWENNRCVVDYDKGAICKRGGGEWRYNPDIKEYFCLCPNPQPGQPCYAVACGHTVTG
ncbi:MAG: hypothetical protein QXP49_07220, partial [Nitrososphaerota archaeon]